MNSWCSLGSYRNVYSYGLRLDGKTLPCGKAAAREFLAARGFPVRLVAVSGEAVRREGRRKESLRQGSAVNGKAVRKSRGNGKAVRMIIPCGNGKVLPLNANSKHPCVKKWFSGARVWVKFLKTLARQFLKSNLTWTSCSALGLMVRASCSGILP